MINKWEVGAKDPLSGGILTEPLYQLKLWLRRKVAEQRLKAVMDGLLEQFRQAAPIRAALPRRPGAKGLLEVSLMDHHLGESCASAETRGMAYDCEISERLFITALEDLLHKSANLPVEKVLMVCGNDFLNTADGHGTLRNTIQDEEFARYHETFLRGRQLLVRAIDRLREVAPVEVVMVTGNHEGQRLYYLGSALNAGTGTHPMSWWITGQRKENTFCIIAT